MKEFANAPIEKGKEASGKRSRSSGASQLNAKHTGRHAVTVFTFTGTTEEKDN